MAFIRFGGVALVIWTFVVPGVGERPALAENVDGVQIEPLFDVRQPEVVELTWGPDVRVAFEPEVWQQWSKLKGRPQADAARESWVLAEDAGTHVKVASLRERLDEQQFEQQVRFEQMVRNRPGEFMRSVRESLAGRRARLIEYRDTDSRPSRLLRYWFVPTEAGHVTVFVVGAEAKLPAQQEVIDAFLAGIEVE